eukprot:scaffold74704_cov30-Tisochrysis_lutea.AAC.3
MCDTPSMGAAAGAFAAGSFAAGASAAGAFTLAVGSSSPPWAPVCESWAGEASRALHLNWAVHSARVGLSASSPAASLPGRACSTRSRSRSVLCAALTELCGVFRHPRECARYWSASE